MTVPEFATWLTPPDALARLDSSWNLDTKKNWILRRLATGEVKAATAKGLIHTTMWKPRWHWFGNDFWETGDLTFFDGPEDRFGRPVPGVRCSKVEMHGVKFDPAGFPPSLGAKPKEGGLTPAEFDQWLRPVEVLRRLPDDVPGDGKQRAIIRRLADGHIRSVARHSVFEDDKAIGGGDFLHVPQSLWAFPWRAAYADFWTTGDINFRYDPNQHDDTGFGLPMVITADTPPPPPPPPPPPYIVRELLDVRLCPADVTEQFGPVDPPVHQRGKGGRPAARWWDDLWIEICRQVYRGEVMPDQQVNIEKAMHAWISAHGYEAGETTVRDRARRLFKALNREDGN